MIEADKILEQAQNRAQEQALAYRGVLLPAEAYTVLQAMPEARIVDVRCRAELDWVGRVPEAIEVELLTYPGMQPNAGFVEQLGEQVTNDAVLLLLCRTGVRSDKAATLLSQNGFSNCYNILEGFEGNKDESGHRGLKTGWKAAGLPWTQG